MRSSPLLSALVSKTKQEILAAVLLQPDRSWYLLELARHLGVRPSSLQRELKLLTEAGILERRQDGNRTYFQADRRCPIFPELSQILLKTAGLVDLLRDGFEPLRKRINAAFVYGSIAASSEHSRSDIDLMVVGSVPLSALAPVLRPAEQRLGRAINPTVYSAQEFAARLKRGNHFLQSVLQEPRLFIIGGEDDLEELAAKPADKDSPNQPAGTQRSARHR